ncbi:RNase adapter RapZ [Wielerella bovis]|uniref:RNase adapter RapZ n=1 Tax=Wielerella bovis TaxID=2917790 RepID=UPI0020190B22|nr:RNase adapter RapZ [Wielerella bovis]MCG7657665.1 RNase adapter RapZ [Wielerella bovis]MCG7659886.1 RNase adapter RapZ [Wielerella bovis]
MKIVLISGLSGSGKTVALNLLEDSGFYCVDNLPLALLPELVCLHEKGSLKTSKLGISIDVRSNLDIEAAQHMIADLRATGHEVEILFLEATEEVLLRRFSETRRSHPLSREYETLPESLQREREWLLPLRNLAYCVDTSKLNAQQLRRTVGQWLGVSRDALLVGIESFGFKHGAMLNADFVFDVRSLPNPYYDPALRPFNGKDKPIQDYLSQQPLVNEMIDDIEHFLRRWLPRMQDESRSYVTVGIGCTGGQHRSVYIAEQLGKRLGAQFQVLVRHRQLNE